MNVAVCKGMVNALPRTPPALFIVQLKRVYQPLQYLHTTSSQAIKIDPKHAFARHLIKTSEHVSVAR